VNRRDGCIVKNPTNEEEVREENDRKQVIERCVVLMQVNKVAAIEEDRS
jgi:hypothetical protein